jgi:hypothetical protein
MTHSQSSRPGAYAQGLHGREYTTNVLRFEVCDLREYWSRFRYTPTFSGDHQVPGYPNPGRGVWPQAQCSNPGFHTDISVPCGAFPDLCGDWLHIDLC